MSQRQKGQKVYKSFQGKQIDMDLLRKKNELTPAVGNARVNARGDELGPGGQIIKKREDVVAEHYAGTGVAQEATGRANAPVADTPVVQVAAPVKKTVTRTKKEEVVIDAPITAAEQEMLDDADEWVEDDNGNFVSKGE